MNNIRQSLSTKLSIGILLMIVPVFVVSLGLLFMQSRYIVRQEAVERANAVLNTSLQRVNSYLKTIETATNANDWQILENLQPDSLLAYTHRIVQLNPHIDGCSISTEPNMFPQYGRYFSAYTIRKEDSLTTVVEEKYEYFERVWYKKPRDLGEACWVDFYDDIDTLNVVLSGKIASYCKPLYGKDNQLVAIMSTDISLRRMDAIMNAEHPYPHSYFILVGEDGSYFIHPDSTKLFSKTIFSDVDPRQHADIVALGHEMTKGKQGNMPVVIDDVPCLVSYHPIPGTSWSLALVSPDSDILENYYQLTYIVLPLLIVGLLVILLLCRRIVAQAINPLNLLLDKTQSIAEGNYEVYITKSQRKDVVGRLQNSFATMLQSLNFHMGSIRYTADKSRERNEELVKATHLAEEADRQKTVFIQNVTHQIRTPLNIIMGFAQVLRDNPEQLPEEEVKNITETMNYNALSLNRMVQMLYDSSETGRSEETNSRDYKEVSCNEVARESLAYTNQHFPNLTIYFKTTIPDTLCIRTNRLYLMRSLREILYNSAKYSDGKSVTLSITETDSTVRFIFQDTGPGISEDYQDLIFIPFTKADDLSEGLGLGLPLTKNHIQNLGGTLTFDNNYHDGCRFIIEMPK